MVQFQSIIKMDIFARLLFVKFFKFLFFRIASTWWISICCTDFIMEHKCLTLYTYLLKYLPLKFFFFNCKQDGQMQDYPL